LAIKGTASKEEVMSETYEKLVPIIFGAILGIFLPMARDWAKRWLWSPNIKIEPVGQKGFTIHTTAHKEVESASGSGSPSYTNKYMKEYKVAYVRIKVTNQQRWGILYSDIAKGCVGYLAGLHFWSPEMNSFEDTEYVDFLKLNWSYNDEAEGMDMLRDTPHWLDVLHANDESNSFFLATQPQANCYGNGFGKHGLYRFTIQLSGENIGSIQFDLYLKWTGCWNTLETMDKLAWKHYKNAKSISLPSVTKITPS
jgi:hypothetical protein